MKLPRGPADDGHHALPSTNITLMRISRQPYMSTKRPWSHYATTLRSKFKLTQLGSDRSPVTTHRPPEWRILLLYTTITHRRPLQAPEALDPLYHNLRLDRTLAATRLRLLNTLRHHFAKMHGSFRHPVQNTIWREQQHNLSPLSGSQVAVGNRHRI